MVVNADYAAGSEGDSGGVDDREKKPLVPISAA